MSSDYQRKLTKANAPLCRICGVRLPKKLHERGVCDFCHRAKMDDPKAFWRYDPVRDFDTDAIGYERAGPDEPEPLPRLDADTMAVERERLENDRRYRGIEQGTVIPNHRTRRQQ